MKHAIIPVWFFVGVLLAIYGALILASGVMDWNHTGNIVLDDLHAPVWWGALLVIVGVLYSIAFRPGRK